MGLEKFLMPSSVAVVGASRDHAKLGWQVLNNIKSGGFAGKIYPINLHEKEIDGLTAYASLSAIGKQVDLAVLVVPAPFCLAVIEECAALKIKDIIIISAGFGEAGAEGKQREEALKKLIAKYKLNILGPNCLGLVGSAGKLNATFAKGGLKDGNIACLSQSGAIGSALLDWIGDQSFGFSAFVSLGNKTGLDENDFFSYFRDDEKTKVVAAYLEEIKDGSRFLAEVSRLAKIKPVIILKSGRTEAGSKAAMSHTGSMAGSSQAVSAALARAGAIEVANLEEMFNLMKIFQNQSRRSGRDMYIISNAGGPLVTTVDYLNGRLPLGNFSSSVQKELKQKMPMLTSPNNPLDIIGDAPAERYRQALDLAVRGGAGNILVLLTSQTSTELMETAAAVAAVARKNPDKLICSSFIGGSSLDQARKLMSDSGVVDFLYPNQAIDAMVGFASYQDRAKKIRPYKKNKSSFQPKEGRQLDYLESFALLEKYGIKSVKTVKLRSDKDLAKLKYPVVMKMSGPSIIHKSDQKCLFLNVKNSVEAKKILKLWSSLLANKENFCLAQPMAAGKLEFILGFQRDPSFGPVLMAGWGGIYAEVIKDVALAMDDINYEEALKLLDGLKVGRILDGARGQAKLDKAALAQAIVSLGRLAAAEPNIHELDINPLFVNEKGVLAVDVRIIL